MAGYQEIAAELIKKYEGLHRLKDGLVYPYICPAGYWTIGYGHLCAKDHPPITPEQAEDYLIHDMGKSIAATLRLCPNLIAYEAKLAAIIDFVFNLGPGRLQSSTLRRAISKGDWPWAAKELQRWVYGGGRILPGLVSRRREEAGLILVNG